MSEVLHVPISVISKHRELVVADIREHYDSCQGIVDELENFIDTITTSGDCNLCLELLMCLDELNGAEFNGDIWWIVDNMREVGSGRVMWYYA